MVKPAWEWSFRFCSLNGSTGEEGQSWRTYFSSSTDSFPLWKGNSFAKQIEDIHLLYVHTFLSNLLRDRATDRHCISSSRRNALHRVSARTSEGLRNLLFISSIPLPSLFLSSSPNKHLKIWTFYHTGAKRSLSANNVWCYAGEHDLESWTHLYLLHRLIVMSLKPGGAGWIQPDKQRTLPCSNGVYRRSCSKQWGWYLGVREDSSIPSFQYQLSITL